MIHITGITVDISGVGVIRIIVGLGLNISGRPGWVDTYRSR
jgi:hypothetical protein